MVLKMEWARVVELIRMRKAQSAHSLDGELYVIRVKPEIVKGRLLVMAVLRASDSEDCIVNVCTV